MQSVQVCVVCVCVAAQSSSSKKQQQKQSAVQSAKINKEAKKANMHGRKERRRKRKIIDVRGKGQMHTPSLSFIRQRYVDALHAKGAQKAKVQIR